MNSFLWINYNKLNFNFYIITSILSHLLFIAFLGLTHPFNETKSTIFDVDIVTPPGSAKSLKPETVKPTIAKRKPPLVKRRPRPADKKLQPETMYGKGTTELHEQGSGDPDSSKSSSEPNESNSQMVEEDKYITSPKKDYLSSEKDGPSLVPHSYLFDKKTIEKFAHKGSPAKKGLTFDTSEFKHRGYMRMLKERIEDIWKYPKEAASRGISGDLYMEFSIMRDGKLGKIELLRTSGYRELDEAAMKAVKNAEPFWPLPDDWEKDTLEIKGHFIYVYGTAYVM
jgi:protein TonB